MDLPRHPDKPRVRQSTEELEDMTLTNQTHISTLPPHLRKGRLRRTEASEYLALVHNMSLKPATLAKLAWDGSGPPYFKCNRSPLYPVDKLDEWAVKRLGEYVDTTGMS